MSQFLCNRPLLNTDEWFDKYWRPLDISKYLADFVCRRMQVYTGLEFSRVRPSDRLQEDLQLSLICWFDWEISLCEDFWHQFGVEICDRLDLQSFSTIGDLVLFLNSQLLLVNHGAKSED